MKNKQLHYLIKLLIISNSLIKYDSKARHLKIQVATIQLEFFVGLAEM